MPRDMNRLLDEIVFLDAADAQHVAMNAGKYLQTARSVREIVERELGALPMTDFVTPGLPTLQTTAENIFFERNRRFSDLDSSGNVHVARLIADQLIHRLGRARVE